jgi:YD repeat-containing protein
VYYRRLQAGDSSPTFSSNSVNNATTVWGALVLRGVVAGGDPFEAAASPPPTWQNAVNPNPPAVTTQTVNAFVLALFGKNNDYTSVTPPPGYAARGSHSNTAGSDASGGAASVVKASPGSEDPGAWSLGGGSSNDDGITWTASVKPAGSGNANPTATAGATPTTGTAPLNVTFSGSGSDADGTIAAWAWDLDGDGSFDDSSAQNPSHNYPSVGTYTARLRVTDNAGAYGFSGPVTITASSGSSSNSNWSVTASASDDVGVSKVEFFVDGDRFAVDSSSPFGASLDTLAFPVYDGAHNLTVKASDVDGNVTASAAHPITVANTAGTVYRAAISTSSFVPLEMRFTPGAGSQDYVPLTFSLTNNSAQTWSAGSVKLRYRWLNSDGSVFSSSADVSIGSDLGAGQQRNVAVNVNPPTLTEGVMRGRFRLRVDLYDTGASAYFADKGNQPYETWVTVTRNVADELGLERYQQYDGEDLGGGFDHALNLANGNNVVQWVPFSQPGRGLNTVVTMTYNALEAGSVSPLGNNWSLSISSLTPFGLPLDVHPNAADTAAGRTQKWVGFTDADGSYHVFTGNAAGTYYTAPPGVHLYLKQTAGGWELWKPDRTKFVYGQLGYPTSVEDANGNALTYTLATPAAGEDAYGLARRVTMVTDAGGRDFTLSYYTKAETPTPAMRGKLKKLTDHVGHALELTYYHDGNLRSIREKGGIGDDGMSTPDREVFFTYTKADGNGPAISSAQARKKPDPSTVQSNKLYSVVDFRANETWFEYSTAQDAKQWRLTSRTNRAGAETTFSYDTAARETTATMPLSRIWTYTFDTEGRVTEVDDPINDAPTTIEWADQAAPNEVANVIRKVTAPSGEYVEYAYNANGYKTDEWDELRNHQTFEYESIAVDANDASGNWEAGRSIPRGGVGRESAPESDPFAYDGSAPLRVDDAGRVNRDYPIAVRDISFAVPGGRVQALLAVPPGRGRLPAVVYLHGAGGDRSDLIVPATWLAARGAVTLALTAPSATGDGARSAGLEGLRRDHDLAVSDVVAVRRALDLLAARPDVDPDRLGFVGYSAGARTGAILAGVEPRLAALVLMSAGASPVEDYVEAAPASLADEVEALLREIDPLRYVAVPGERQLLLQNGRRDEIVPREALDGLAGTAAGAEVRWYDAGHALNDAAYREQLAWLARELAVSGPPIEGAKTGP